MELHLWPPAVHRDRADSSLSFVVGTMMSSIPSIALAISDPGVTRSPASSAPARTRTVAFASLTALSRSNFLPVVQVSVDWIGEPSSSFLLGDLDARLPLRDHLDHLGVLLLADPPPGSCSRLVLDLLPSITDWNRLSWR